jgi:hypothetical protein
LSERQEKGEALESLTYEVLKEQLLSRLGSAYERATSNGLLCVAKNYQLFWNKQVVKQGGYPKVMRINDKIVRMTGKRKSLPDIVLCDKTLLGGSKHGFPDPSAVLAIELKNTNLNFQWTNVRLFDRDVMERFLWTPSVFSTLSMDDGGWEKYAVIENLFPNAIRVLITPKFAYHTKASEAPTPKKVSGEVKLIMDLRRAEGLAPQSESHKDHIDWRIKKVNLRIEELGYQPLPRVPIPDGVRSRMYSILTPYLDRLGVGYRRAVKAKKA